MQLHYAWYRRRVALLDAVVVTYNSSAYVRACVEPLCNDEQINVVVVDNHSTDDTVETVSQLDVRLIRQAENRGFAVGCNTGWHAGTSKFVVFLNPDCRADPADLRSLVGLLDAHPTWGAVGPRLVDESGAIEHSQHRFLSPAVSFARAMLLHRLLPRSPWTLDVTDPLAYDKPGQPDWLGGACIALRRETLEELNGFDERFFMYCEDMDLCKRIRQAGAAVHYTPEITIQHAGGASAPKARMIPTFAYSRIRYARKHGGVVGGLLERLAVAIESSIRVVVTRSGSEARRAHARAVAVALSGDAGGG